jgi:hypothetical protein
MTFATRCASTNPICLISLLTFFDNWFGRRNLLLFHSISCILVALNSLHRSRSSQFKLLSWGNLIAIFIFQKENLLEILVLGPLLQHGLVATPFVSFLLLPCWTVNLEEEIFSFFVVFLASSTFELPPTDHFYKMSNKTT